MISLHPASGMGVTERPLATGGMGYARLRSLLPPVEVIGALPVDAVRSEEVWTVESALTPEQVASIADHEIESRLPVEDVKSELPDEHVESELPTEEIESDEPGE